MGHRHIVIPLYNRPLIKKSQSKINNSDFTLTLLAQINNRVDRSSERKKMKFTLSKTLRAILHDVFKVFEIFFKCVTQRRGFNPSTKFWFDKNQETREEKIFH